MNNIIETNETKTVELFIKSIYDPVCLNYIDSTEIVKFANLVETATLENLTLEQIKALYAQKGGDLGELIGEQEAVIDARDFLRNLADKVKASSEYTGANGSLIDDIDIGLINAINLLNTIIHTKPINPDHTISLEIIAELQSQNAQLIEAQEKLVTGYKEAIDDIESWASYASDYFKDKHDLQGCVSAHKALLADIEKGNVG